MATPIPYCIEFKTPAHQGSTPLVTGTTFRVTVRVYVSTIDPEVTATNATTSADLAVQLEGSSAVGGYTDFTYLVAKPADLAHPVVLEMTVVDPQPGRGTRSGEIRITVTETFKKAP